MLSTAIMALLLLTLLLQFQYTLHCYSGLRPKTGWQHYDNTYNVFNSNDFNCHDFKCNDFNCNDFTYEDFTDNDNTYNTS
jgi:hypothetical protein